jgi:hypothetical protein
MTTNDESKQIDQNLRSTKDTLQYYKDANKIVHIVLKNRRFYNGSILDIRDYILIFQDNKIGEVPIPIKDVYLVEIFQEPNRGGEEDGDN